MYLDSRYICISEEYYGTSILAKSIMDPCHESAVRGKLARHQLSRRSPKRSNPRGHEVDPLAPDDQTYAERQRWSDRSVRPHPRKKSLTRRSGQTGEGGGGCRRSEEGWPEKWQNQKRKGPAVSVSPLVASPRGAFGYLPIARPPARRCWSKAPTAFPPPHHPYILLVVPPTVAH
jgi:hypothetical protein